MCSGTNGLDPKNKKLSKDIDSSASPVSTKLNSSKLSISLSATTLTSGVWLYDVYFIEYIFI